MSRRYEISDDEAQAIVDDFDNATEYVVMTVGKGATAVTRQGGSAFG